MKNFFLLLIFLHSFSLLAQNTIQWFVAGSQWHYSYIHLGGTGEATFKIVSDTLVDGIPCKHLVYKYKGTQGQLGVGQLDRYMLANNDSIFVYQDGAFVLLYDFTMEVGDTIQHERYGFYSHFVLDSLGTTSLFGLDLKTQYGRLINPSNPLGENNIVIYERLGGPVLDMLEQGTPMVEIIHYLDCYRDDEVPFQLCNVDLDSKYIPFRDNMKYSETEGIWYTNTILQYQINGDTMIEGGIGLKVFDKRSYQSTWGPTNTSTHFNEPYKLIGILAQDMLHKKVYFKKTLPSWDGPVMSDLGSFFPDSFHVLYDFDLNIEWYDEVPTILGSNTFFALKDSVQLKNGEFRNRYFFGNFQDLEVDSSIYWIEGVGGNFGLFTGRMVSFMWDVSHGVRCIHRNNTSLWGNVPELLCEGPVPISEKETALDNSIFISPNPASNFCIINLKRPEETLHSISIEIRDALGRLAYGKSFQSFDNQRVETSNLESGIYFVRLFSKGRLLAFEKLLIQH